MVRAAGGGRGLAVRWPVPVGALAAGCGLAVLVYQAGAVPLPGRHGSDPVLGPLAPLHGTSSADAPPRSVLRPADVTQQLLVAVQLAPAAATSGVHASSRLGHVAVSHHTLVLTGGHTAPPSLVVVTDPPATGSDAGTTPTTPTDPSVPTDPGTLPTDPGTLPTDPGTLPTDPGTLPTDPGTLPTDPGTLPTDPGTLPTDPGTLPTDPGTLPTDPGTLPPTDPGTTPTDPGTTPPPDPGTGTTLDTTTDTTSDTTTDTTTDTTAAPAV